jgi:hypothetical protein
MKGEGDPPSAPLIYLILGLLKHLIVFSADTIEKDEFKLEIVENRRAANAAERYILSIEEI